MLYSLTLRSWCETSQWWVRKSKACWAFWVDVLLCVCVCACNCVFIYIYVSVCVCLCILMCAYYLLRHSGKEDSGMVERPLMYQLKYCVHVCVCVWECPTYTPPRGSTGHLLVHLYIVQTRVAQFNLTALHREFTVESGQLKHWPIWAYRWSISIFVIFSLTCLILGKKRSLLLLSRRKINLKIKHVIRKGCHRRVLLCYGSSTLLTQEVVNLWDVYILVELWSLQSVRIVPYYFFLKPTMKVCEPHSCHDKFISYIKPLSLSHDLLHYDRGRFSVLTTLKHCQTQQILKIYTLILRCIMNYGHSIKCVIGRPVQAPISTS